jgi:hypothetical protein
LAIDILLEKPYSLYNNLGKPVEPILMLPTFSLIIALVLLAVLILIENLIAVGRQKVQVRETEKRREK